MDGGREIRQAAADGVDEGSAPASEPPLGEPIRPLVERLQRQRSRAQRLRRPSIPPEHGQRRPWGIPAGADTRLPLAVRRLLTASDAQACLRCREGYRPPMGAVDAVDTLTLTRPWGRDNGVVAAESTGVFDPIHHEGMIRRLAERLEDQALRWVIKQWLNAGGLDTDGQGLHPVMGPPPGGIRSPLLAKVDLHDALEWGCEQGVTRRCRGEACLRSYADDCGCALEPQEDAARVDTARGQRRGTGGRERSAETTPGRACRRQPPGAQTSVECWGGRVSLGDGSGGASPSHPPALADAATERPAARHPMGQDAPPSASGRAVGAAPGHAPWVRPRLRGPRPLGQPPTVLLQRPGAPAAGAPSASPTAP